MSVADDLIRFGRQAPWLMEKIESVPWLDSLINRAIINGVVEKCQGRPLPRSLWTPRPVGKLLGDGEVDPPVDYISWQSLVDRRFTARHLPPADAAYAARLPPLPRVLALYQRDAFTPSKTTSALLCF
ncbi:MAG TPA: hypothetical protein VGC92_01530, partial [Phenylobacterium sp.]